MQDTLTFYIKHTLQFYPKPNKNVVLSFYFYFNNKRIVGGLEFVNTEERKGIVRIVEGMLFVNMEVGLQIRKFKMDVQKE